MGGDAGQNITLREKAHADTQVEMDPFLKRGVSEGSERDKQDAHLDAHS
jgi:hypothetical protein